MKKKLATLGFILLCVALVACDGKKDPKDSAVSMAQKWCDLNAKAAKAAANGNSREAAKMNLEKFEDELEAKYKDNKAFMDELGKEVEKCEAASEGRPVKPG